MYQRDVVVVPEQIDHGLGGVEEPACRFDLDIGAAELAVMAAFDIAAELGRHGHLAVANPQYRNAGVEDRLRGARRALFVHGFWTTRENNGLRLHLRKRRFRLLERHDLGMDALLPYPARNQLRHLATVVDDQNIVI